MSNKRVYLHIGEPKCGTTFLQEVLFGSREVLSEHGLAIPGIDISDHYRAAQDILGIEQDADDPGGMWAGSWDALAKTALTAREPTAIITHELICGVDDEQAARAVKALSGADVHVIVTARDLAGLLPAEWQETVKHKNVRSWHQWLSDVIDTPPDQRRPRAKWFWSAHDTVGILRRWAAVVGVEQVHLVTVPPSSAPPDLLWRRFAQVLGLGDAAVDLSQVRANASLGVVEVEMLRRLNERLVDVPLWFYARQVKGKLAHGLLAERPKSGKVAIPQPRHAWVRRQSAKRIKELRSLGVDIVGDLSELAAPETFPTGLQPVDVTDGEMLDAALDTLAAMYLRRYQRVTDPSRLERLARGAAPGIVRVAPFRVGRAAAWRLIRARRQKR